MSDTQILTIALAAVPTMLTVLVGILINNFRLSDMNTRLSELRSHMDARFNAVDQRFNAVDQRFDDMRDMWRSELHRVEEVLDARLKHIEERS
jgi:vacuolar-type H+-ATPase subunit I/STV1